MLHQSHILEALREVGAGRNLSRQRAHAAFDEILSGMTSDDAIAEIGEPFGAMIVDKDEVTLVIPADAVADFSKRLREHRLSDTSYRLITFDIELEATLTGFMARISQALADAGIPILPFAAFSRDHLLVPSAHFDTALSALKALQANG